MQRIRPSAGIIAPTEGHAVVAGYRTDRNVELTVVLALGIAGVDIVTLRIAVRLFQRESITLAWR